MKIQSRRFNVAARVSAWIFAIACLLPFPARAADAVEPESVTITNLLGEAQSALSQTEYYEATTLRVTGYLYTNAASLQGLDGVTVEVRVGTSETNIPYTASIVSTAGIYSASVLIPTNGGSQYYQVKATDAGTNVLIWPWKVLYTRRPLR